MWEGSNLFLQTVSLSLYKLMCDSKGQYILLTGYLEGSLVTLISFYAQNMVQLSFFRILLHKVFTEDDRVTLLGGDFNVAQDSILDKTWRPSAQHRHIPQIDIKLAKMLF